MKIAIVGGGIFGTTIAWFLAKNNPFASINLYEKNKDIFMAASGINQYRLHRGYHYPRSLETLDACIHGEKEFREVYPESILHDGIEHYYAIAKEDSLFSARECFIVWKKNSLEYKISDPGVINKDKFEACVKVNEYLFDPLKLKQLCWQKLREYGVNVILNKEINYKDIKDYDFIIIATYAFNNSLLDNFPHAQKNYQFEVIEKLILKLPREFNKKSIVIIDGPFMCIDPFSRTGYFAMGNVVHAIHKQTVDKLPIIPDEFKKIINNGVIKNPPLTNFKKFIESASQFFKHMDKVKHIGSMFTIRTVLPYHEHDDARPTIVEQIDKKTVTVFSGKIPTCIDIAKQVQRIYENFISHSHIF